MLTALKLSRISDVISCLSCLATYTTTKQPIAAPTQTCPLSGLLTHTHTTHAACAHVVVSVSVCVCVLPCVLACFGGRLSDVHQFISTSFYLLPFKRGQE